MTMPETHATDLKAGSQQRRFIGGKPYYVTLRFRAYSETANPVASRWRVAIHDRDSHIIQSAHDFDYLTDARRSFRTLVRFLADGNTPHQAYPMGDSVPPCWASFKSLRKSLGITD